MKILFQYVKYQIWTHWILSDTQTKLFSIHNAETVSNDGARWLDLRSWWNTPQKCSPVIFLLIFNLLEPGSCAKTHYEDQQRPSCQMNAYTSFFSESINLGLLKFVEIVISKAQ